MELEEAVKRFDKVFSSATLGEHTQLLTLSRCRTFGLLKKEKFDRRKYVEYGTFTFNRKALRLMEDRVLPLNNRWAVRLRNLYAITRFFRTPTLTIGLYKWKYGADEVLCVRQEGVILLHALVANWHRWMEIPPNEVFATEEDRRRWAKVELARLLGL